MRASDFAVNVVKLAPAERRAAEQIPAVDIRPYLYLAADRLAFDFICDKRNLAAGAEIGERRAFLLPLLRRESSPDCPLSPPRPESRGYSPIISSFAVTAGKISAAAPHFSSAAASKLPFFKSKNPRLAAFVA